MLKRESGHLLRMASGCDIEGEGMKRGLKRSGKWRKNTLRLALQEEAICRSKWTVGANRIVNRFR